jgi:hypothetical protein
MDEKSRRAIAHLAEAIYLLASVRDHDDQPTVPVTIGDNQILISPKTAEAIADAIDAMNNGLDSDRAFNDALAGLRKTPNGEDILADDFSAAAIAQHNPDLYAQVTDIFMLLDPIDITDAAMRDRQASLSDVSRVLDELYGDVPYPYADEDVPLPHDQTQMDALTAEVENFLRDGGE